MTGESAVPLEELLGHSGWLRALAVQLLRDEGEAEEAVQETWLRALRGSPRHWGNPRAWLSRVLRSAVADRRREARARARRERQAARVEALPDTGELVVEAEQFAELVSAVRALAEPYRSTVLLRYFHDLDGPAVGRRMGVSASAVRSRLSRALQMLRADLDRRHGDRRAWATALAPLLETRRSAVLAPALGLGAVLIVGSALSTWVAGGGGGEAAPGTIPGGAVPEGVAVTRQMDGAATGAAGRATAPLSRRSEGGDSSPLLPLPRTGLLVNADGVPLPHRVLRFVGQDDHEDRVVTDATGRFV